MTKLIKMPDLSNDHICFINPKEVVAVTQGFLKSVVQGNTVLTPQTVVYTTSGGAFKMDNVTATEIIRKLGL